MRQRAKLTCLGLLVLAVFGFSLLLGRYPGPYVSLPGDWGDPLLRDILITLRLPRVLCAFVLGMVLSAAGLVFQMIFRNPLVDSGFLGVSAGAAFGASFGIMILGGSVLAVQGSAALCACMGLGASYAIARRIHMGDWVLRLVLSGIAVSAICTAGTGVLKYLADPLKQLPDMTFWMLGGLWGISWADLPQILPVALPAMLIIYLMRWRLNLLALRDETTFSLTTRPELERLIMLVAAVLATAAVVSKAGQIMWVGLIVPHISRRIFGADAQRALPGAIMLGGFFVLICDDVARTVLSGEMPLGVLTSFTGASVFIFLLMRGTFRGLA